MYLTLPKLYLITDRHQIQKGRHFLEVIEELLLAGVRMVQLREKDLSAAELLPLATELRELTKKHKSLLLINDRIDVAQAIEADGVHLGKHSLPIKTARHILGPNFLIGASTHTEIEVESAKSQGADFITYGPVFFTPSKSSYGEPKGIESLKLICQDTDIPVYALGGIKEVNLADISPTGAHGVAMISALIANQYPAKMIQHFKLNF